MRTGLILVVFAALFAAASASVALVPTPEQLELVKTMSPEDRQALMEQLGIGGGAVVDSSSTSQNARPSTTGQKDSVDRNAKPRVRNTSDLPADKILRPEDSILIDI